ncbi:MAG: HNH endonuclease [Methanobacterium paludis]|nr:HNH endonuclease [Methanobacterium paludis]
MFDGKAKRKTIIMHRLIMGAPKGMVVDHINHNGLDNRKSNLRVVTHRQNMQNRKNKGTSNYPGVHFKKENHKWVARIRIGKEMKYLGIFDNERTAAKKYEEAVREMVGEELVCKVDRMKGE